MIYIYKKQTIKEIMAKWPEKFSKCVKKIAINSDDTKLHNGAVRIRFDFEDDTEKEDVCFAWFSVREEKALIYIRPLASGEIKIII